jgi:hypothetical protein
MTTAQRTAIATPANGLLVFDNTTNSFWFYNGAAWAQLNTGSGSSKWNLNRTDISNNNTGNVGIGTTEPLNKLHIAGNLLVNTPTTSTSTATTAAQTKTIVNASTISFLASDSTGRIYDPAGPAANYIANLLGYVSIPSATGAVGIEITVETMGLGIGDSLIIKETSSSPTYLLAVSNGYTATRKWVFNSPNLYLIFKSNSDANVGSGFSLLFRRLYDNSSSLPDISGFTGKALFFDTKNSSLRSGLINNAPRGIYSTAMGYNTTAKGDYSTAMGKETTVSGESSTAMGQQTTASGENSTAMGRSTTASGYGSTAMGQIAKASGFASTAMGQQTTASGDYSTAMGSNTVASGKNSIAMGFETVAQAFSSISIGRYNDRVLSSNEYSWIATDPLLIIGNGRHFYEPSNALVVYKNGNTDINGYTRLGNETEAAPSIKMKKLTGTSGSTQAGSVFIPHGLNRAKIIGVQVLLTYGTNVADIPSGYNDVPGYEYNWQVNNNDVWIINKNENSANILSKPIRILITYEE